MGWTKIIKYRSIRQPFAEIHNHDNAVGQSIPAGLNYVKINAFANNGVSYKCTPDHTNDQITITKKGIYRIDGSFSFSCGTNNVEWFCSLFMNNIEQDNIHFTRKIQTAGDVGSASFTGFLNIDAVPINLDVRARHDNIGNVTITFSYLNLNVQYVGIEE